MGKLAKATQEYYYFFYQFAFVLRLNRIRLSTKSFETRQPILIMLTCRQTNLITFLFDHKVIQILNTSKLDALTFLL